MNKYQEALDLLACNSEHWVINKNGLDNKNCDGVFDESDKAKVLIQELVDRATPKKPYYERGELCCKACGEPTDYDHAYCGYCGQKLDD